MRNALPVIVVGLILAILGCRDNEPAPATSTSLVSSTAISSTAPTTQPTSFVAPSLGVSVSWPPGWTTKPSQDYVLMLVSAAGQSISLDVPDLPVHLPGMIPIGLVKNGYLDDLRKHVGKLDIVEESSPEIPHAKARFVHSSWSNGDHSFIEIALLLVHADRVYIIRADSSAERYQDTRTAFDAVVRSLQWTKNAG
jgi:hypothetical protein